MAKRRAGQDPRGRPRNAARRQRPRNQGVLSGFVDVRLIFSGVFERHPRLHWPSSSSSCPGRPTCSRDTTPTASATARRFTGSRACPREGGDGMLPSDFFRRNVVLSLQEDAIGIRLRDVIGVDNMMWGSDYPHSESTFPQSRKSWRRSWGRAGRRTGQACPGPRSGDRRRQHRPRVQFRRGEADRPCFKSQPLCGSTSSACPRGSQRPHASSPGATWRRPWPGGGRAGHHPRAARHEIVGKAPKSGDTRDLVRRVARRPAPRRRVDARFQSQHEFTHRSARG